MLHNFNSGPSVLPREVLEKASEAILDFNGIGLSLLEISHRSTWFVEVMEEARRLVKQIMQLNDDYDVLFLHGGATTQFMQVPMNLLDANDTAAYCDNGIWGSKAFNEAKLFGNAVLAASSKEAKYNYIPKQLVVPADAKYLHITSNNTVEGTQWFGYPDTTVPVIADMSSDIFSRELDYNRFDLIYAGAQKNMGAAGVNLIVVKKSLLGNIQSPIPAIMDYRKHIDANSLLNTPPVFAVYVAMLTLQWIIKEGGLAEMEKRSIEKTKLLYDAIDRLPVFNCPIVQEDRSRMNAVFFIEDEALQNEFLDECKTNGMIGVKGYRTVGGIRVSMYNALAKSSVEEFVKLMEYFSGKRG